MKQKEALEVSDGGVSFDFVCNEVRANRTIYRTVYCHGLVAIVLMNRQPYLSV
jgi:hypothetical protein